MTPSPNAPRLLYFTARYWPGSSMAIPVHAELVRALAARGYPGAIVTLAPAGQRQPVRLVPDGDLPVYRVATGRHAVDRVTNRLAATRYGYPYLWTAARYLRPWLHQRLAESPATILQLEIAFPMGALARLAARRDAARAVVSLHGGDVLSARNTTYGYARSRAVPRALRETFTWVRAVRAMSPLLARRARELGCPPEKLAVIPPNISDLFYPTESPPELRAAARAALVEELGLPAGARVLLASGRALPIKGFATLLDALPRVGAHLPDVYLVLYGPDRGDTLAALRAHAARLGVADRVQLLGEVPFERQTRLLAAADLAVIPSLLDGFNKFGAEAGAHGTPIVASTAAGIADYVEEIGAGLTVPPADPARLADALLKLLVDRDAWEQASAAATRLADRCRTARVADALAALYRSIEA